MPHEIQFNKFIQPAKLPTSCDEVEENATVIIAGTGRTQVDEAHNGDTTLRHAYLRAMAFKDYGEASEPSPYPIICANSTNRGSLFSGDSGNSLINSVIRNN